MSVQHILAEVSGVPGGGRGDSRDDRRHSLVVHIAKAISVRDFKDQVAQRCPLGTTVPSDELVRLQFVPAHKSGLSHSFEVHCTPAGEKDTATAMEEGT